MTDSGSSVAGFQYMMFLILFVLGIILTIISISRKVSYSKEIKKLDDYDIDKLDKEMNNENAFYYEKTRTYLTDNYIVNLGLPFSIIRYSNILWMYRFEQRTNVIKTEQSNKVLTNDGVTRNIVRMDVLTKKQKEILDEIWNTIISKNDKMLIGYTKENISKMKEKVKEIKQNRRTK